MENIFIGSVNLNEIGLESSSDNNEFVYIFSAIDREKAEIKFKEKFVQYASSRLSDLDQLNNMMDFYDEWSCVNPINENDTMIIGNDGIKYITN